MDGRTVGDDAVDDNDFFHNDDEMRTVVMAVATEVWAELQKHF